MTTLGGFALQVNGVVAQSPATRKARALLAFLVMNSGVDTARERLLEIFWPDAEPDRARASLNTALYSIRRSLRTAGVDADRFILATKAVVRWTARTALDAVQFGELAANGDRASAETALQLYRGDFLEGDYDDWSVRERERLSALYETVLSRIVKSSKDVKAAQRFIARNPYDEDAYVALVEAELASGRRSSAASWVERCRTALAEVGETPSASFETRFGALSTVSPLAPQELTLPFAGRESELALIAGKFEAAREGRGSVTIVHGEAGIGKSALLARAGTIATVRGLRVVSVQCNDQGDGVFGPWPKILGVEPTEIDSFVAAHASDPARAVATEIGRRMPDDAVLLVDDAHELKREELDILIAVLETTAINRAAIITSRPEGVADLRAHLADVAVDEIVLSGLDRNTLQWALAQTLGGDQPEVFEVLFDRTAGHPLFFTGLLNSLFDTGALARSGYRWQFVMPSAGRIDLPHTVRRFIGARLGARGDAPRALACALALEPSANAEDLGAALRFDDATTLDALDDLLALGLIQQPPSGPQFAFAHDLIREVAATVLNAGRRAALHRAFAQRLSASGRPESPFRLARHYEAAGESLLAARAYLRSAREMLELNAPQDAQDRCESGIRALETVEPSAERTVALASLYRMAAHAELANGHADNAVGRARDAVSLMAGADDVESARATLDLAVLEGQVGAFVGQRSDASEAARTARRCENTALEAEALLQLACANRELGLRAEADTACEDARRLAIGLEGPGVAPGILQERICELMTWWSFGDALETARANMDVVRRAGTYAEAEFILTRSALWYLLGRFDEADADLDTCRRVLESARRVRSAMALRLHSAHQIEFASFCMTAKVAIARSHYDVALEALAKAERLQGTARLASHATALALLRIDALLLRNAPGDVPIASSLADGLNDTTSVHAMLRWSDSLGLARARIAARKCMPDAPALLRRELDNLEESANHGPLDVDVAFARLEYSAALIKDQILANRADSRAKWYKAKRIAAAAAVSWRV